MISQLASNMQWPFAMIIITIIIAIVATYIFRRTIDTKEISEENSKLRSENYRLTNTKSEE